MSVFDDEKTIGATREGEMKYLFGKCHDSGEVLFNISLRDELTVD